MRKLLILAGLLLSAAALAQNVGEMRDTLDAARVSTDARKREDVATQTSLTRIDGASIGRGFAFLGSPDVIKMLQQLPGVASGTELMSGLYVRGGDGSDNLFLLDGVPMYQVSHLIGLFSSFNADIIDNVDFYKGGFPARYGGRMSSVVDVTTREGDYEALHGHFGLGNIDGRLQLEGPLVKGKTSFNLSLRRTWMETFSVPLIAYANHRLKKDQSNEHVSGHYLFGDLNAKLAHKFSPRSRLVLNFYRGRDNFGAGDSYSDHKESLDLSMVWGNTLTSLDWNYDWSDNLSMKLTPYYSRYKSNIGARVEEEDRYKYDDGTESYSYISLEENIFTAIHDGGLNLSFVWTPGRAHTVRFGATGQYHAYEPGTREVIKAIEDGEKYEHKEDAVVPYRGGEAAAFFEDEIRFSDRWRLNLGLRDALFFSPGKTRNMLEPRVATRFQASERVSLRAAYAAMNQFAHQISSLYIDLPINAWMPSTALIAPMHSDQYTLGVYAQLPSGFDLTVEGWYKNMTHLYEYCGQVTLLPSLTSWERSYTEGRGRSYGGEFSLEYRTEKLQAAAYYTLSWSERYFEKIYPEWYRDRNDNRHKLTLTASWRPGKRFELYGGWTYHSGNRITFPTSLEYQADYSEYAGKEIIYLRNQLYSKPNNVKLPDYHRLDLGFNFHRTTRRGREALWNFSLYNAYCRMNAVAANIERDSKTDKYKATAYGLIPIVPSLSYSLKF